MTNLAPRCPACGDTGQVLGSLPSLPVSAPLILIPCEKCKNWKAVKPVR